MPRCKGTNRHDQPCGQSAIPGGTVCGWHGGKAPQVKARAAVRAEVMAWGLGDAHSDPGEVLLRLVTQSAQRAELYAGLLQQAYEAAEQIRAHHAAGNLTLPPVSDDPDYVEPAEIQQARIELDRLFNVGGVAALVGHTYSATSDGDVYATGEAIRGLAELEAKERDRCATFAAKAIAAGLAKRQVELAERQGALIAELLRAVLTDPALGLTAEQRRQVPDVARRHLALAAG